MLMCQQAWLLHSRFRPSWNMHGPKGGTLLARWSGSPGASAANGRATARLPSLSCCLESSSKYLHTQVQFAYARAKLPSQVRPGRPSLNRRCFPVSTKQPGDMALLWPKRMHCANTEISACLCSSSTMPYR